MEQLEKIDFLKKELPKTRKGLDWRVFFSTQALAEGVIHIYLVNKNI